MTAKPKPPAHLSAEAKRLWRSVCAEYDISDAHDMKRLQVVCECWDTICEARKVLKKEGMFYRDRYDNPRKHPAMAVLETARISFLRAVREMGLDVLDGTFDTSRPPRIGGAKY